MRKLALVMLLLCPVLVVTACKRAPLVNVESAPLGAPAGATLDQVTEAIKNAGELQGWNLTAQKPGQFLGKLFVGGKHTAIVNILYDTKTFSIVYESSQNLNYKVERSVTYIHPNYLVWVDRLKFAIQQQAGAI